MLKLNGPLSYILVGLFSAIIIYSLFLNVKSYMDDFIPSPPLIEAIVNVPNFEFGTIPIISYQRTIYAQFRGIYYVEVKNSLTGETVCDGQGSAVYTVNDKISPNITLDWYINEKCSERLTVGQYYLDTSYVMDVEGNNAKRFYSHESNIFTVTP